MSKVFPDLDGELMSTPVYQRAVRSLFKRSISRPKGFRSRSTKSLSLIKDGKPEREQQTLRSRDIDDMLKRDDSKARNIVKLALLGQCDDATNSFLSNVHSLTHELIDREELLKYRSQIVSIVLESVRKLLTNLEPSMGQSQETYRFAVLQQALVSQVVTPELASLTISLWRSISTNYDRAELISCIEPFPI